MHLAVGGTSPDALYELGTSQRLAQDLMTVRALSGKTSYDELPAAVRSMAETCAKTWLRDRAAEAASPTALTPELADRIDNAAQTVGRWDIVRLAREMGVELVPNDAARWAALARVAAHELDVAATRAALGEAKKYPVANRVQAGRIARAESALTGVEKIDKLSKAAAIWPRSWSSRGHTGCSAGRRSAEGPFANERRLPRARARGRPRRGQLDKGSCPACPWLGRPCRVACLEADRARVNKAT